MKLSQLMTFLSADQEIPVNFDPFLFKYYEESSVIGEGVRLTVREIRKQEKLIKKELKLLHHKSLRRIFEGE